MNTKNISTKYTFPLFETICFINGKFLLSDYHIKRMENSSIKIFGLFRHQKIFDFIKIPSYQKDIRYKCRIAYNENDFNMEFSEYKQKIINNIHIVEVANIDYSLKYSDRSAIEFIKAQYSEEGEILITQNGFICDTSIANVVVLKSGRYYTPDTCLLEGVQRANLLESNEIMMKSIHVSELKQYEYLLPINAMNDLEYAQKISISSIKGL